MSYGYLKSKRCAHLLHRGVPRTRYGIQDKATIDEWLQAKRADQFRDDVFLKGSSAGSDPPCFFPRTWLDMNYSQAPWRGEGAMEHLLFINALPPPSSGLQPSSVESPIAIMDYYGGDASEGPAWTHLTCTMSFRMDRGRAAELFSILAVMGDNLLEVARKRLILLLFIHKSLLQPGLSQQMIDWACYAAEGTCVPSQELRPETPRKGARLAVPERPCKSRRNSSRFIGFKNQPKEIAGGLHVSPWRPSLATQFSRVEPLATLFARVKPTDYNTSAKLGLLQLPEAGQSGAEHGSQ
ncbi:hypothetical protein B0H16DRAFT_1468091 [Mycena metata]|uniref:Uncharacterized protein n=1 Tax=Mycena metata TaxID=1033252 RepID=A0AAD7I2A1_9AGAR|nr:hypothetical protein B0H16DRAFT_1468091 [Mycena metata]